MTRRTGALRASTKIKELIKSYEQCRLVAYLPTPNDKPTIGWGSTGSDIKLGMRWSQTECDLRFERDLAMVEFQLNCALGGTKTTQGQFDAMVSLVYNIGITNFKTSTLLRMHKAGRFDLADAEFDRWIFQNKRILKGLQRRRNSEQEFYDNP